MPGNPDVPKNLEGPERPRTPLHKRLLSKLPNPSRKGKSNSPIVNWKAFNPNNVGLHLSQDPNPEQNATHRKLPEEHRASYQSPRLPPPKQPHELSGPVPRRANTRNPEDSRRSDFDKLEAFKSEMALTFLTQTERNILHSMRRVRRSSFFRPLLEPKSPVLLVNPQDIEALEKVKHEISTVPAGEDKERLTRSLGPFLASEQIYTLKLLVFNDNVQIRSNTKDTRLESPEVVQRPQSEDFFGYVMDLHYDKDPKDIRYENEGIGKQPLSSLLNKRRTFEVKHEDRTSYESSWTAGSDGLPTSYSAPGTSREFQGPYGRDWPPAANAPSCLRGGGDEPKPQRTTVSIFSDLVRGRRLTRLEDDERVPRGLYWLAGGNTRKGRLLPTGKTLRARKQAEEEAKAAAGDLGAVAQKRAERKREVDQEIGDALKVVEDKPKKVYMSGGRGSKTKPSPPPTIDNRSKSTLYPQSNDDIDDEDHSEEAELISPPDPQISELLQKARAKSTEESVKEWLKSHRGSDRKDRSKKASSKGSDGGRASKVASKKSSSLESGGQKPASQKDGSQKAGSHKSRSQKSGSGKSKGP